MLVIFSFGSQNKVDPFLKRVVIVDEKWLSGLLPTGILLIWTSTVNDWNQKWSVYANSSGIVFH